MNPSSFVNIGILRLSLFTENSIKIKIENFIKIILFYYFFKTQFTIKRENEKN